MADADPAQLANVDQSIAHMDEIVPAYVVALADLISEHGRAAGISMFTAWLHDSRPPDVLAMLAAGAMARLVDSR